MLRTLVASLTLVALASTAGARHAMTLDSIAVIKRFPQLKSNDAMNLDKVRQAIQLATPDMFVRINRLTLKFRPSYAFPEGRCQLARFEGPSGPLAKYEAKVETTHPNDDGIEVPRDALDLACTGKSTPSADTPALIWETNGPFDFTLITLDGGRYTGRHGHTVEDEPAVGLPAEWPEPLGDALVTADELQALAKHGDIDSKIYARVDAADKAWGACVNKIWNGKYKASWDKVQASNILPSTRTNRRTAMAAAWSTQAQKACAPHAKTFEKEMAVAIEKYNALRTALYAEAKAKLAATTPASPAPAPDAPLAPSE